MGRLDSAIHRIRSKTAKQLITIAIIALLVGSIAGLLLFAERSRAAIVSDRDCSANSVMECGCITGSECAAKMHENGQPGMEAAYAHFGLSPGGYDRFASQAIDGMVHPDGTVTLSGSGEVVMTSTSSIGRTDFGGREHYPIGEHDFYMSSHSESDILQGRSLPVLVLMDDKDEAEFAMIKPCGNPIKGEKVEKKQPPKKQPPKEQPPEKRQPKKQKPITVEKKQPQERPRKEEKPAKEMPVTGAGSVLGVFASATGAGAAAHHIIVRRRR